LIIVGDCKITYLNEMFIRREGARMIRDRWRQVPSLARTPLGRFQILHGVFMKAWPLLSCLASLYRLTIIRKTRIVAVVGSLGKSTTTRAVISSLGGNVNTGPQRSAWSFLARAVLRIRPRDRHAVIEVGIDGKGQMVSYAQMIRPDITVVTSIGSDHHRSLRTLEVTRSEKAEMVRMLPESGIAILNGDDPNVLWMKSQTCARVITFGMNDINDVRASDIRLDWPEGTCFTLLLGGKSYDMKVRLIGRHMVYPILAAAAVAHAEGFPPDLFLQSLQELNPTVGRMQPVYLANGAVVLRDDYKSGLETIEAALDTLSQIPAGRRIVVMGEINEPPRSAHVVYRNLGKHMAQIASCAIFIGSSSPFKDYSKGARQGGMEKDKLFHVRKGFREIVHILQQYITPGDVVLIKGRSNQKLERVTFSLMGEKVSCDIGFCKVKINCDYCPMLRKGWNNIQDIFWI
jgi:UDP-N-acetylmuramoyl-tripeptide--D-alanyl-D-alanine ligase